MDKTTKELLETIKKIVNETKMPDSQSWVSSKPGPPPWSPTGPIAPVPKPSKPWEDERSGVIIDGPPRGPKPWEDERVIIDGPPRGPRFPSPRFPRGGKEPKEPDLPVNKSDWLLKGLGGKNRPSVSKPAPDNPVDKDNFYSKDTSINTKLPKINKMNTDSADIHHPDTNKQFTPKPKSND